MCVQERVSVTPPGNEEHVVSNIVIFRSADGKTGYRQADTVDEAARFVERIRNSEGVDEARIYKLEEVVFEFKPYFRVEVGGSSSGTTEASGEVGTEQSVEASTSEPADAESATTATPEPVPGPGPARIAKSTVESIPMPTPVEVEAKRGIFSR